MEKIKTFIKKYFKDLKSIPTILFVLFVVTVIIMNFLAKKTIFQNDYIAIDGAIIITWLCVVISDIVTIVCGPKTTVKMTFFAIFASLFVNLIFYLVSLIPAVNSNATFGEIFSSTWFIVISSAIAFICSNSLDAFLNYLIGTKFKEKSKSKLAIIIRVEGSTILSTIFDNFIFNLLTFVLFAPIFWDGFHWSIKQCIFCALLYGAIEIVIELIMLPITIKSVKKFDYKKTTEVVN